MRAQPRGVWWLLPVGPAVLTEVPAYSSGAEDRGPLGSSCTYTSVAVPIRLKFEQPNIAEFVFRYVNGGKVLVTVPKVFLFCSGCPVLLFPVTRETTSSLPPLLCTQRKCELLCLFLEQMVVGASSSNVRTRRCGFS